MTPPAESMVFEQSVYGAAGASQLVITLREGPTATTDPDAAVTIRRGVRLLAIRVAAAPEADGATSGYEHPSAGTADALARLIEEHRDAAGDTLSLVSVGEATRVASALAVRLADRIHRFAIVDSTAPASSLDGELWAETLGQVRTDTLVVVGEGDSAADADDARWFVDALPRAASVVVAERSLGLSLGAVWPLVLDHVVPATAGA